MHHTEREERRDIWDRDMFKDLMKDAERTLAETYDKDAYKGIVEKADYLLEHPDMPLWLHAGEGLGFLMNNDEMCIRDRMMAAGAMARTSSAVMSQGTISEYTCKSRTRRAMSCPYWAPKSTTITFCSGVADSATMPPWIAKCSRAILHLPARRRCV